MGVNSLVYNNELICGNFVAPRAILEMYQKVSFSSFKVWASLLADITEKNFSEQDQFVPLNVIWQALDGQLSSTRLITLLDELQTTLIKKDEFLTQTAERKITSFNLLGPVEITVNKDNDVKSLKYRLVKELLQILKSEGNKEQFIIEMRTFISLKGKGGEHAKSLVLFCTPYIPFGETKFIDIDELRAFMGLNEMYVDENGNTAFKTFKRDVLNHAIKAIEANPYVNFQIDDIETKREGRRIKEISFKISERRSIKNLLSESVNDHSSPADPQKLKSMLITFWLEALKSNKQSHSIEVLTELLREFKLVDKYINDILNEESLNANPQNETFRIFSIATAITQLWIDGQLKKENSKIYSYAYKIFITPSQPKVDALCQKFISSNGLNPSEEANKAENIQKLKKQNSVKAKALLSGLKKYYKVFNNRALCSFADVEIKNLNEEFIQSALRNKFGAWTKKAVIDIKDSDKPLTESLTKRTYELYLLWIADKAVELEVLPQKSVSDFLNHYPDQRRHVTFLNLNTENVTINEFESLVRQHDSN